MKSFKTGLFLCLILHLSSGLLLVGQAWFLDHIYVSSGALKGISLAFFVFGFFQAARAKGMRANVHYWRFVFATLLFLSLNAASIFWYSMPRVGWSNSLQAFAYNYSFLPFFGLALLIQPEPTSHFSKQIEFIVSIFVMFGCLIAFASFQTGSFFLPPSAEQLLAAGDHMKFDHIGGIIRGNGWFRSPLDLGMFASFMSALSLARVLRGKKIWFEVIRFIVCGAGVLATVSRTAMVMALVSNVIVLGLWISRRSVVGMERIKPALRFVCMTCLSGSLFVLFFERELLFTRSVEVATDSTNFLNRWRNWAELLRETFQSFSGGFWGLGKVQNGRYGYWHTIEIDNTYIGIVLTGGLLGLGTFILLIFFGASAYRSEAKRFLVTSGPVSDAAAAALCGFAASSLTENNMRIAYYAVALLLLLRWALYVPKTEIALSKPITA